MCNLFLNLSGLYSHPGVPLEKHLVKVARIAAELLAQSPVAQNGALAGTGKEKLHRVLKACALCHDLGKATAYFQRYLLAGENEKKKLKNQEETRHGLLSAVAAFFAARAELGPAGEETGLEEAGEGWFLAFAAFLAVKRHHGDLQDVVSEAVFSADEQNLLFKQVASVDREKLSVLAKNLKAAGLKAEITPAVLNEWVRSFPEELRVVRGRLRGRLRKARGAEPAKNGLDLYLLVNFLFSLLIDADKSEVTAGYVLPRNPARLTGALVDRYKSAQSFARTPLNDLREEAYREVTSQPLDLGRRIFSLNLPTGLGKTLISLAFALRLREKVAQEQGFLPRLIYCLPFLSIIEQNAAVFQNVFTEGGLAVDSTLLLKHHHLAEIRYTREDDEFAPEQAKIFLEGWQAEVVVTTFVQFFHTLVSNRNKTLRKFHRLAGSIIILDEVQAIPFKYWLLLKELLPRLTAGMNVWVVLATATEPLIFPREQVCPLIEREKYFARVDRVVVHPCLEKDLTLEEFAGEFTREIDLEQGKSFLFVFNTIQAAREFYAILKEKGEEITYLSTHVTPAERLRRIEKMRKGQVRLAVTTQLVEAGVDIDFDVVYRDLAPLDAINQAAGRCNRNGRQKGKVVVVSLRDARRLYASYVYDAVLLEVTRNILRQHGSIAEKDFLRLVESYYRELQEKKSSDESRQILAAISGLRYARGDEAADGQLNVADFKLIAEDYPKLDVFIELNEEAAAVWERFLQIKEIPELIERRLAFSRIKADFYNYTVAVPVNVENLPPEVAGFRYVNRNSLDDFYDRETGFKVRGTTAIW